MATRRLERVNFYTVLPEYRHCSPSYLDRIKTHVLEEVLEMSVLAHSFREALSRQRQWSFSDPNKYPPSYYFMRFATSTRFYNCAEVWTQCLRDKTIEEELSAGKISHRCILCSSKLKTARRSRLATSKQYQEMMRHLQPFLDDERRNVYPTSEPPPLPPSPKARTEDTDGLDDLFDL